MHVRRGVVSSSSMSCDMRPLTADSGLSNGVPKQTLPVMLLFLQMLVTYMMMITQRFTRRTNAAKDITRKSNNV